MKRVKTILGFTLGALVSSTPAIAASPQLSDWGNPIGDRTSTVLAENVPATDVDLGAELLQSLTQCVRSNISNPLAVTLEALQVASTQCMLEVVLLDDAGNVRRDANSRMLALIEVTGVTLPIPTANGQAVVPLQPIPNSQVYSLNVNVDGFPGQFLLDTGASGSIVSHPLADELGVATTPVPGNFFSYFAVGDDCSDVEASLMTLPSISVETARVEGITGMGLPPDLIPGNADGVLGIDVLSRFDVTIDPQTQQLQLLSPTTPDPTAIPLQGNMGMMTVELEINDRTYRFGVDTGADLMVISQRVAADLNLDLTQTEPVDVVGFCGTESSLTATLDRVRLGTAEASNLDAVVLGDDLFNIIGIDGLIGQNFLDRYRQHWRFGEPNALGYPEVGSLELERVEEETRR
ncbi:retropepsin-like aspartic protease [Baaleninema simplex]|uniref:retropepsin-like aspartic protease n=1 Tax=Baaleninema simplex TaxID=2862350 RepID=UPI00034BB5B5|nr:retropepsin-like aspartic protease [Baaleninema simplex]